MIPAPSRAAALACALLAPLLAAPAAGKDSRYVEDLEFIARTVAQRYAALRSKDIDWKEEVKRARPAFEACADDVEHAGNVMRLLAVLRDSHTGVTRGPAGWEALPSKWDGLYGAGLWFAWEEGRVMLRGSMEGHALAGALAPGSALVAVEGLPAWLVLEREKRRITTWSGSSSDHSLFSSMGNRFLPFGQKREIEAEFMDPERRGVRKLTVARWGPGGGAFTPSSATLPPQVPWQEGACAGFLVVDWCPRLGYLRITGGMNAETARAFHAALDALAGAEAILLDCRGMGGGGDGAAWEMAGRFFPAGADNGIHGRIEASGGWQYDGPLVMLQDESEVSSAETFTWAMSETERCVSVGRPTGGWGIIPAGFQCPSGLVDFRLGVNDRPTPIRGLRTEGVGWPADVRVPYGPVLCARPDPVREVGLEVLRALHGDNPLDQVRAAFAGLFAGEVEGFRKQAARLARKAAGWSPEPLARRVLDDLEAELELELELLRSDDVPAPDVEGAARRLETLAARARAAGLKGPLKKLESEVRALRAERSAQGALLETLGADFAPGERAREAFLDRHGKTRTGRFAREVLWARDR